MTDKEAEDLLDTLVQQASAESAGKRRERAVMLIRVIDDHPERDELYKALARKALQALGEK